MKVAKDHVVTIEYQLRLKNGTLVDQSEPGEPLEYLQGHGQIVPGLEREIEGMQQGESKKVVVQPSEGYGAHDEGRIQVVPRTVFPDDIELTVGEQLAAQTEEGETLEFTLRSVGEDSVTVDFNHPLAGEELHFDITITAVRPATRDELAHGHAHGPGGHHHH